MRVRGGGRIKVKTKTFAAGDRAHMMQVVEGLLREYVDVELVFSRAHSKEGAVQVLLQQCSDDHIVPWRLDVLKAGI